MTVLIIQGVLALLAIVANGWCCIASKREGRLREGSSTSIVLFAAHTYATLAAFTISIFGFLGIV